MKKVKNNESKKNAFLEIVKEGKIKKRKQKKKQKNAVVKLEDLDLAPKIETSNLKTVNDDPVKAKKKIKPKIQKGHKISSKEKQAVAKCGNKTEGKEKKSQKDGDKLELEAETSAKELTEAELKKIEKKKAKKLAQKLRKEQNKDKNRKSMKTVTTVPPTNEKNNDIPAGRNVELSNSKVLTKKEKKAQKRKLIQEQKFAEKQSRDPNVEAATVFVGNIPVNTKRVQLIQLFQKFRPVYSIRLRSAGGKILFKHKQRKNSGALNAYVVLKDKETAEKALSLNGVEFKGHHLRITLSSENPASTENNAAKRTVFVGNLKYSSTEESLHDIFSSCGEIDYVRCIRDGDKGCKGVAYVRFKTPDAVGLALELNKTIVDERPINVERFSEKKLGAKEAREAQAEKEVQNKKGAKQRIAKKTGKKEKTGDKNQFSSNGNAAKMSKKSEFRGVKAEGLKKKLKSKKKKSKDQNFVLAKKIAPKPKAE